jgi:hypothetical protein
MTKDEALRLALKALYGFIPYLPLEHDKPQCDRYNEAITAIKEALANEALDKMAENARELGLDYEPAQRTWVGLTDEEIEYAFKTNSVMVDNGNAYMVAGLRAVNIAQAIEAKLRSKNS